ncbi:MAG: NAD(P)H-dependent oxidoreductase [Bacteroides sp.]
MIAILFAHPWHGSYNKALLDAISTELDQQGKAYQVIDLHQDQFNPVLTESELALYSQGKYSDPLVGKYQEILKQAEQVIFLFPIWWNGMPAILTGFLDKVMLVHFSHNYENGWTPLLDIAKTLVITTSQSPTAQFHNAIYTEFIQHGLGAIGFKNPLWLNCDNVSLGSDAHRQAFIQEVIAAL